MPAADRLAAARARVAPIARAVDRSWPGRFVERLFEIEFIDKSVALGAKAFVAFFPLLLAVAAFTPNDVRASILATLQQRSGIGGQELDLVRGAFQSADATRTATGVLGLVLLFFYATTFTTALQRLYLTAWRRPRGGGVRNQARGLAWITGIVVLFAVGGSLRRAIDGPAGDVATGAFSLIAGTVAWWWTAWIMLRGEVRWRPLLPGAVTTAVVLAVYSQSAEVWMPRTMASNQAQFGFFGVALSLVTWFSGIAMCLVVSTVVAPVLAEDGGAWGRLGRGRGAILRAGAPAAVPAPQRRPTFLTALGGGTASQRPVDPTAAAPPEPEES